MPISISSKLLSWYELHGRTLPWRDHSDTYAVWVSEVMLQQTRVETVIPYFYRWMDRFPTLNDLAEADQQEVLRTWEGLGYYNRARNIHRAAKIIQNEYGGEIPRNIKELQKLPGIGRYTAHAIASLAFGQDVPIVDGNIKRVLARLFDIQVAVDTTTGEKEIWRLAGKYLPPGRAKDFNQALMDLGALVCIPQTPRCDRCPLREDCRAFTLGLQQKRPVKKPRMQVPHYNVAAAVIRRDGCVLITQRPDKGLLGGLWEFPGGKQESGENLSTCLKREIKEELDIDIEVGKELGVFRHGYTHFKVTLHAFFCEITKGEPHPLEAQTMAWVEPLMLIEYPMGKIDRQISNTIAKLGDIL
jgi:A/G-specific adenine glycosylase